MTTPGTVGSWPEAPRMADVDWLIGGSARLPDGPILVQLAEPLACSGLSLSNQHRLRACAFAASRASRNELAARPQREIVEPSRSFTVSQPLGPLTMTHSGRAMDVKHAINGNSPGNPGPITFSMSSPDQVLEGTIAISPYVGNPDVVALEVHLAGKRLGSAALTEEGALDLALRLVGTIMNRRMDPHE